MMNDMAKDGDMKGASDKRLVPELRFPEFKKDWNVDFMQSIFDLKNGYTPSKSNPTYWDNGTIPWFRMEDIRKNGHILSDSIQHVTQQAVKNAGLFPAYSIIVATTATIGEHALVIVDSLANQQFTFLTKRKSFKDKINMMYFHHYMFIIDEWCKKNTNSGGLISVNMPAFKQLLIPFPSLAEQQKIAECLSSIDEEISAMKEKVEQLKIHKKGLMQKLFPAAGKFVPKFRFPEFEKEWGKNALKTIIKTITPPKKLQTTEYHKKGMFPIIDQSQSFICGFSDDELALVNKEKEDVVIFGDHTCILKLVNFTFIQGADGIKIFKSSNPNIVRTDYIYQYLSAFPIGVKEYKRHYSELKEIIVCYSYSIIEQQKIAECLSSIDELISLYENKVILLEQHKKGLMQRLFPKL